MQDQQIRDKRVKLSIVLNPLAKKGKGIEIFKPVMLIVKIELYLW